MITLYYGDNHYYIERVISGITDFSEFRASSIKDAVNLFNDGNIVYSIEELEYFVKDLEIIGTYETIQDIINEMPEEFI